MGWAIGSFNFAGYQAEQNTPAKKLAEIMIPFAKEYNLEKTREHNNPVFFSNSVPSFSYKYFGNQSVEEMKNLVKTHLARNGYSNITQGWYFLTQEDGSTSAASHNSAEWIVEAVTRGSGQAQHVPPLANFGSVTFTNCSADGKPISSWTHAKVQITQPSNHFLLASNKHKAYPSSLQKGGKNFTVTWSK